MSSKAHAGASQRSKIRLESEGKVERGRTIATRKEMTSAEREYRGATSSLQQEVGGTRANKRSQLHSAKEPLSENFSREQKRENPRRRVRNREGPTHVESIRAIGKSGKETGDR